MLLHPFHAFQEHIHTNRKPQLAAQEEYPPMRRKIAHGQRFYRFSIVRIGQNLPDFRDGFAVWTSDCIESKTNDAQADAIIEGLQQVGSVMFPFPYIA